MTFPQRLTFWRQRCCELLAQRPDPAAIVALRRYANALEHVDYLRIYVRKAEVGLAEARWTPPSPRQLLSMADHTDNDVRLVQSADQLHDIVVASVRAANEALQGNWPLAWQLWNDPPTAKAAPQPRSEERLSDWLKAWLDRDLEHRVVTAREPQARPTVTGQGLGARTDLRIELPAADGRPAIAVIVEVKRRWHRKVRSAIRAQLANGYLAGAGLEHGVYVVGVYDAPNWVGPGSKSKPRRSVAEWQAALDGLARETSVETGRVIRAVALDVTLRTDRDSA